jgi:tetratricopeptide (TPR) repeat protein
MQRPAYREAVANLDRALIALARQPEDRRTQVQFVDVNFALGVALLTRGDLRAALVRVQDALSVAERLNDVHRIAQNSVRLAHVFIQLGQATDALPHGRRALDVVKTLDAAGLHVAASTIVGLNHYVLGDYGLGEQHFDQSLELIRSGLADGAALPFGDVFRTYAWLVLTLVELGEFDRALAVAREVMARAETAPYPNPLVRFVTPWVHMSRGDFDLAIPDLERGLAICTSVDHLIMVPPYLAALGRAYSLADRSGEAIPLLERAIEMGESHNRGNRSLFLSFLAEAYLHVGRFDDATRMARRGLEGARDRKERGEEAWSLHALGAIAARLDPSDTETAHGHFCDAMALGGERGMRPLIARCHLGLGGLYRRTGDRGKAREHLAMAAAMLREIGMAFWVRQAEAQVAVLSAL